MGHFRKGPRIQRPAAAYKNVLLFIQLVGDGGVRYMPDARMPKRFSVAGAKRQDVSCGITGEGQSRIRGQNSCACASPAQVVRPAQFPRFIIDRLQLCLSKKAVIRASPAIFAVLRLGEINAVAIARANEKQTGLGIETWRAIIGRASFVRRNQSAIARRLLRRIRNGASALVHAGGPIDRSECRREKALPGRAVQHKEITIARSLQQHLARSPFEFSIDQNRNFDGIPIVRVVRRRLETPDQLAGVGIEGHNAAGPGIVARAILGGQHGRGISGSEVNKIEFRIVSPRDPHVSAGSAAAKSLRGFSRKRAVKGPLRVARLRIKRFQHAWKIVEISGGADQDVVPNYEGRHRRPIALLHVRDLYIPLHVSVSCIEADQVCVRSREVHGILVQGNAPMTDVQTLVERISVVPHGIRGTSIEGPYVIRSRYVQNTVEKDGRGLNLHSLPGWESPGQRELVDIRRSNLRQGAVALAGRSYMFGWPTVLRWF